MDQHARQAKLGWAWVALALATALHVADEALTGFLPIYNSTVLALRHDWSWFPVLTLTFGIFVGGLMAGIALWLALSPFVFRGDRWTRPIAYFLAALMILNAAGHTTETIVGHTVTAVRFPRPAPGFYSSPVLVIAAVYLLFQLRMTRGGWRQVGSSNRG